MPPNGSLGPKTVFPRGFTTGAFAQYPLLAMLDACAFDLFGADPASRRFRSVIPGRAEREPGTQGTGLNPRRTARSRFEAGGNPRKCLTGLENEAPGGAEPPGFRVRPLAAPE